LNSSVLVWPDRQTVDRAVREWARDVAARRRDVRRIGYFGSYARGDHGVGSDLDVVAIVAASDEPFVRRAATWPTEALPVPTDLLVYTEAEWSHLMSADSRFAGVLKRQMRWIWPEGTE
jgi:hypothetical protein